MNQNHEFQNSAAIIGMSGRFPGASGINELWTNLCAGKESITFFSDEELDPSINPKIIEKKNYVKARGILKDSDKFDARFFGISPREAEMMDPQHRLFLENAWHALENAGYYPDRYPGMIGVYGGGWRNTYYENHISTNPEVIESFGDHQTYIANGPDYITTRVSYKLNLNGPSVNIYTACSTSLVAVCMAFEALLSYQCDMALAGGVYIMCPQNSGYLYQRGTILSPDGHIRPFDARANGTVFSNGIGAVLIKRFEDAIKEKDHIYAIIRGVAMNNDGSRKVSFTAPSVDGQADVIAMALANADVEPETITYIETHGTGTLIGDPIEIAALTKAFQSKTSRMNFCAIGSLKANIGHMDAAAGVGGLIKTALALYHKKLPPSINFEKPNPEIDFTNSPFYVNTELSDWTPDAPARRAGVSCFGVGGTNAHVILEEAPEPEPSGFSRRWQLLSISAKSSTALETATANIIRYLKQNPNLCLPDVAYTLETGRKTFNHRRIAVCQDVEDAITKLETLDPKWVFTSYQESQTKDIAFIFSGQGSQYVNMGLDLYKNESFFKDQIDLCSDILKPQLSFDLREILFPETKNIAEATELLEHTANAQPALFTIEYALAKLWESWGIYPRATVGHSIGEYVAACLSGVFSLEDALALVATRGRLMGELAAGSMLAVFLSEKEIEPFLNERLSIAAINSPSICVASGEKEAINDLEKALSSKKIVCRYLRTSHAFHSQIMEPILDVFTEQLKKVNMSPPKIPFLSNVTGTWITEGDVVNPAYWTRHLRQTVRFSDCIEELFNEPNRLFIEVGPGDTFSKLTSLHPQKKKEHIVLSSMRHPNDKISDLAFILKSIGQLWLSGISIDWSKFYANEKRHRIPLPTYPFERKRHWIDYRKRTDVSSSGLFSIKEELEASDEFSTTKVESGIEYQPENTGGNKTESVVANIFQKMLGVEKVGLNDNFFSLGGSSIMAVGLFAQIERIFNKNLPLATLYEAPTVSQLAEIINNPKWKAPWDTLIEIQAGGDRPPLFLIHAAGGNVLIYRELASHLCANQPVYGLQSRGLDGVSPPHTRIEDMAAEYIKEIKNFYPNGPYLLGGYCLGGTVALEMAQQLLKMSDDVALLALFETYNFSNIKFQSFVNVLHYYIQKIVFHCQNFLLLNNKGKLRFLKEKVNVVRGRKQVWLGMINSKLGLQLNRANGQAELLADIWEINDQASLNYVPRIYSERLTQFLPCKDYAHHRGVEVGWNDIAAGGLETHVLPVYPAGMLVEPFVQKTAEKVKDCIERALNHR